MFLYCNEMLGTAPARPGKALAPKLDNTKPARSQRNRRAAPEVRRIEIWHQNRPGVERALWRSVIAQAVRDALGLLSGAGPTERDRVIRDARQWLCEGDELDEICDLADLDGEHLRAWALDQDRYYWPDAARNPDPSRRAA